MTMHKDFAGWYSKVDLGENPDRVAARWKGLSALIDTIEYKNIGELIDLYLGRPGASDGATGEYLRSHMTKTDATFPQSGNDAELSALAESALAILMDTQERNRLAGYAATAVFTALCGGAVKANSSSGLLDRARFSIEVQGRKIREREELPSAAKSYAPKLNFDECIEDGINVGDPATAREVMKKIAGIIAKSIGNAATTARNERNTLEYQLKIQDEELDLLWWASNGQSDAAGKRIPDLKDGVRALIAGSEAADRTQFEPGPCAIAGLLEKTGLKSSKKQTIAESVNACDEAWLRKIAPETVSARTPIHFAIAKRLEAPESDAWIKHWSTITGIKQNSKLTEIEIAYLFYQERLVLDMLGGN